MNVKLILYLKIPIKLVEIILKRFQKILKGWMVLFDLNYTKSAGMMDFGVILSALNSRNTHDNAWCVIEVSSA